MQKISDRVQKARHRWRSPSSPPARIFLSNDKLLEWMIPEGDFRIPDKGVTWFQIYLSWLSIITLVKKRNSSEITFLPKKLKIVGHFFHRKTIIPLQTDRYVDMKDFYKIRLQTVDQRGDNLNVSRIKAIKLLVLQQSTCDTEINMFKPGQHLNKCNTQRDVHSINLYIALSI